MSLVCEVCSEIVGLWYLDEDFCVMQLKNIEVMQNYKEDMHVDRRRCLNEFRTDQGKQSKNLYAWEPKEVLQPFGSR